jgi:membrane glycosyltransferase
MVDQSLRDDAIIAAPSTMLLRRILFFALVALSMIGLTALAAVALSPGGFDAFDFVLLAMFAVTEPWYVIGFWNALIGFLIMRFASDPAAAVTPVAGRVRGDEAITTSTAILACIRNEPPERPIRFLAPLIEGLVHRDVAAHFHLYVLSDTDDASLAATEETRFAALADAWRGRLAITYRRRPNNTGFKAGNVRDFLDRWGKDHDCMVVLDADSLMTADAVTRLVRIMQADPRIGILQSLVTGLPSTSAFARIFQFGMRLAMRSYTLGSAWWQGDCGPYWGHNAIVRIAPFMTHCELPILPEGALISGHVLSHDQIEAVLMRRAGYEVRVLADEGASFEQNPPTLLEFIRRDRRWCQGNMQYLHFLRLPGLHPISRYQLVFALLMFLGSPAWMGLLVIGTAALALTGSPAEFIRPDAGIALFVIVMATWFAPKLATTVDVLLRPSLWPAFGGGLRFAASACVETIFILLLAPIMWFAHTAFLGRLLLGRSIGWSAQARDDHMVPLAVAVRQFWPQTLLGFSCIALLAVSVPSAIPYAFVLAGGPLLSIPLAVLSALPTAGSILIRLGIGRLPEETAPPPELRDIGLSAIDLADRAPA